MEFHDDYPQYELMAHHNEEEGKKARRTLWNVFWVMLIITIVELIIGFMAPGQGWSGTFWLKSLFITLTIAKAGFIVMAFMHLGHEQKFFKYTILLPYTVLMVYTIFIVLNEGIYSGKPKNHPKLDPIFAQQQINLKSGVHHNAATINSAEHSEEHH